MDLKLVNVDKEKKKTTFLLKDTSAAFANTLRRIMMEEVPTMAIEKVEFRKSSSVLYDEMIAHRLGLVVLKTDLKSYELPSECSCKGEGCSKCQLKLLLKVKGPRIVYASDIESQDPKVVPVFPKTIITKLSKTQELELEATAVLGTGQDHMKWAPGIVYYMNEPVITVKNDAAKMAEFKDKYPPQIFDGDKINKDKITTGPLVDAVDGICDDLVKVEYKDNNFLITIESWGQLSAKEIATRAAEVLSSKTEEFVDKVKKL